MIRVKNLWVNSSQKIRLKVQPNGPTREGYMWSSKIDFRDPSGNKGKMSLAKSPEDIRQLPQSPLHLPGIVLETQSGQWFEYEVIGD